MAERATASDAELVLKLYDLRREAEMRKARNWWLGFWPESVDDIIKVVGALGTQENAWMRQVGGYWDMAASLVLHGALNKELFLEPGVSGEMFLTFAKMQPFLKELREKTNSPTILANVEKVISSVEGGMERVKQTRERILAFRKMAQAQKA